MNHEARRTGASDAAAGEPADAGAQCQRERGPAGRRGAGSGRHVLPGPGAGEPAAGANCRVGGVRIDEQAARLARDIPDGAVVNLLNPKVAVFFLAMDSVSIEKRLAMVIDRRPAVTTALASFSLGVRRYWVVATLFGLVVALLDVVVLAVIGAVVGVMYGASANVRV